MCSDYYYQQQYESQYHYYYACIVFPVASDTAQRYQTRILDQMIQKNGHLFVSYITCVLYPKCLRGGARKQYKYVSKRQIGICGSGTVERDLIAPHHGIFIGKFRTANVILH